LVPPVLYSASLVGCSLCWIYRIFLGVDQWVGSSLFSMTKWQFTNPEMNRKKERESWGTDQWLGGAGGVRRVRRWSLHTGRGGRWRGWLQWGAIHRRRWRPVRLPAAGSAPSGSDQG
jgi:hypothetical protein